ncbi:stage III sporulation protein AF [Metabacillus fastidiosus]|uniref:stage III sporulation protein AF n=1 Tax=Metabacillus fastidiosus TaxID=1458 RepID=UPI002DB64CE7|nr:stage III sporulation protein AF [Metabacillus fastidiosus]MEC2075408.1 stage III sporulation protein AF [Metabacillus fastidiosus]
MEFLTGWITNIILFILLAVIIDLLLPSSAMQKYAKIVISLLLIVVIINPIFKLFSADMDEVLAQLSIQSENDAEVKNLIEKQKSEIEASQRAYILEQMAVQMKEMAEEELVENYEVAIDRILLSQSDEVEKIDSGKDLQHVEVVLQAANKEDEAVEVVKKVDIDTSKEQLREDTVPGKQEKEIITYLAKVWEVDQEKILLQMKGGEESLHE